MRYEGIIKRFSRFLPVSSDTPAVTLNEGNTLLLRCRRLEEELALGISLYLKFEGQNPTGSFKDRGMTMAISKAVEENSRGIICASTGNTAASAAAYAARAGLKCFVIIPEKAVALGKLAQALIHGAEVLALQGNFDQALELVKEITARFPLTLVNSVNPHRLEGQKTGAFEVCEQLGRHPHYLAIPVGNAGNISAYWQGFKEYNKEGIIDGLPRMLGFQAEGAAPLVHGKPVQNPETIATAIRIGNPASWDKALTALRESGGRVEAVSDEQIINAYGLLASREGIFAEPASAASLAGVIKLGRERYFKKGEEVVCVLTGNGLKDPDLAIKVSTRPRSIPADYALLEKIIQEKS